LISGGCQFSSKWIISLASQYGIRLCLDKIFLCYPVRKPSFTKDWDGIRLVYVFCFGTESVKVFSLIYYVGCVGLWITTECGRLQVSPGEIAVLPQGFRFAVNLPDGPSRGYVAEVFGAHFQLPDLGPIGT
jgi:hypothetical protein